MKYLSYLSIALVFLTLPTYTAEKEKLSIPSLFFSQPVTPAHATPLNIPPITPIRTSLTDSATPDPAILTTPFPPPANTPHSASTATVDGAPAKSDFEKIINESIAALQQSNATPLPVVDTTPSTQLTALAAATTLTGAALAYWACNPEQVATAVRSRLGKQTRMPLLAAPLLIDLAKSAATPIVGLAITGIVYYKIKDGILSLERDKHKQQIAEFDKKLSEHKQQTAATLAKYTDHTNTLVERTKNEIVQLRTNITTAQKQVDDEIAGFRTLVTQTLPTIQEGLNASSKNNGELSIKIDALQNKVVPTLTSTTAALTKLVDDLGKQGAVLVSQGTALRQLRDATARELGVIKAELGNKKDKKK